MPDLSVILPSSEQLEDIKLEMANTKADVASINGDVSDIKADVANIKETLGETFEGLMETINHIKDALDAMGGGSGDGVNNEELLPITPMTWDGESTQLNSPDIGVPQKGKAVLVMFVNASNVDIKVKFLFKISEGMYVEYGGADGEVFELNLSGGMMKVFGPIQAWPRFLGGRVELSCESAPPGDAGVVMSIWEV